MSGGGACIPFDELLAYWLDDLDEPRADALERHLFGCAECNRRLGGIVDLGAAVRRELLDGAFGFVLPEPFVRRIKAAGLRVREYSLEPGGSVDCTIAPDDDLVVSYLRAPLADVRRLDMVIEDALVGTQRVSDLAFDPGAAGVTLVPSVPLLRSLGRARQRVRLVAVDGLEERVLGDYTFNHSPS